MIGRHVRRLMPALVLGLLCGFLTTAATAAVTCTVGASGVAFGVYDPFAAVPDDSVGTITVTCSYSGTGPVQDATYVVRFSPGTSGTFANRQLANGQARLRYNLYLDAARTQVLGDGLSGTSTIADTIRVGPGVGNGTRTNTYSVYGRMPALQDAVIGAYADALVVTLTY